MKQLTRALAVMGIALFALTGMVLTAGTASAHSSTVHGTATCASGVSTITWSVTNSESDKVMTVTASNNGAVPTGTTIGNGSTGHYDQVVTAAGDYSLDIATSWPDGVTDDPANVVTHVDGGCTPPAPTDVCDNLPGNQPAGTPCSHEPEVTVTPQHEESCALGGVNSWTRTSTVDYVFNDATNSFDPRTPVVVESTKVFTTWTAEQLAAHGCTSVPPVDVCQDLPGNQPTGTACSHEPTVEVTPRHEESCALGGSNDSTSTSTVSWVFNSSTNTFDAQPPVVVESATVFTAWTAEELATHGCTVVSPPVVSPPVVSPPVVSPPVVSPPVVSPVVFSPAAPQASPAAVVTSGLPDTGADGNLVVLSALGLACLAAGGRTLQVSRRK